MTEDLHQVDACEATPALVGYLSFVPRWKGSKSERFFPCLLSADGALRWLKHRDDTSFDHKHLRPFHLRSVRLEGNLESTGVFIVDCVTEMTDPWPGSVTNPPSPDPLREES